MYLVLGCAEGNSRKEDESMREEKDVREHTQVVLEVKNPPVNAGDIRDKGSIPGLGRSPRGGHNNPLQYSCLENPKEPGGL